MDALGRVTEYAYDRSGNQLSMTDARGHTTSFVYDELNRPTVTTFHDNTSTETIYDALGRRVASIDQEGKRTDYEYDGLGRLISVTQPAIPDGQGGLVRPVTRYQYDEAGNQIAQTDALGRTTRFSYDSMGRRTTRTLPEGQTETYTYNDSGTLATRTDFNGHTTTYTYDAMDRLLTETADPNHPSLSLAHATAVITYTYDDAGNLLSAVNENSAGEVLQSETYTYDERGRLVEKATPQGVLSYTYDESNNLTSTQSSNTNGLNVGYSYDVLNRLETVEDYNFEPPLVNRYAYDQVGNLERLTYANGVTHDWTYDSLNRLTNIAITQSTGTVFNLAYTLSDAGMRTRIEETGGRAVDYAYDNLYRLTSETISGDGYGINGTVSYAMDLVGNRAERESTVSSPKLPRQTFSYDANDWLEAHDYDANGNTILADGETDTYDFKNRLIRRTTSSETVIDITYNAFGDRIEKKVNSISTAYLVDRNNLTGYAQVVEELQYNTGWETTRVYVYGLDLISQDQLIGEEWQTSYYHYDGLGTVRGLSNVDGLTTDAYFYDAYGVLLNTIGTTPNVYLYTGEQFDADLGMYFLRARYMEPESGRFWTMDTYEGRNVHPATLHKYLYVHANPMMGVDPSGHKFRLSTLTFALGVAALISNTITTGFSLFLATQDLDGNGDFIDGFVFSASGSISRRGGTASIGADLVYHRGSSSIGLFVGLSGGIAPITNYNRHGGQRAVFGSSSTFGLVFNMQSIKDWSGWSTTSTWPLGVVKIFARAYCRSGDGFRNQVCSAMNNIAKLDWPTTTKTPRQRQLKFPS